MKIIENLILPVGLCLFTLVGSAQTTLTTPLAGDADGGGHSWTNLGSVVSTVIVGSSINAQTLNASTLNLTNIVIGTNSIPFTGGLLDFSHSGSSNMTGDLTITGITNLTSGGDNYVKWTLTPGGSDRRIIVPAGWGSNRQATATVSNVFKATEILWHCQPGVLTNYVQIDSL